MPPKQATLGKFFGNPNGARPAAQQTKLAFSQKVVKTHEEESKENQESKASSRKSNGHIKNEAQEEERDEDVVMEKTELKSESDSDVPAVQKRKVKSSEKISSKRKDIAADEDDHSSPPAKKARTSNKLSPQKSSKPPPKLKESTSVKNGAKQKTASKTAEVKESASSPSAVDEDDEDIVKPKKGKKIQVKVDKTPQAKTTKKPSATVATVVKSAEAEDELSEAPTAGSVTKESTSDHEDEAEELTSEDDDPEAAAQSQEKIRHVLEGSGKDPYPDWKAGDPVPFAALCTTYSKIEMTTKRLEISAHCSKFLQQVLRLTPNDLQIVVLLMINKLAADYVGIELGIGESLIMKAIGESTGRSLAIIKADQKEIGDLGLVAAKSRSNQPTMFKPKPLTVRGVQEALMGIAQTEGKGAQERKVGGIKKLLSAADTQFAGKGSMGIDIIKDKGGPSESKFIVRMLEGKLRLGLAEKSVLVALSNAVVMHESKTKTGKDASGEKIAEGEQMLKSIYSELPSYEVIIPEMLEHGIMKLREHCNLRPGVPLKPMLAKPTKSITEVLDRFEGKDFTCEYKYDGERAQIHYVSKDANETFATAAPSAGKSEGGVSNIFSRNSEDLSKKYPDILQRLPAWVKEGTKSFVLDCETVAWDVKEKQVLPFQQLMTRKRKDVKAEEVTVQVCVFAFDMLYLNGEALVNKTFRERREALRGAFNETEGEFKLAQYGNTNELEEIQTLLEESVKASCEGLMVKMLDGPESSYEPSKRSQNWLKVKKDYLAGVGDSLDLVVLGAYFGKGKRTSWYGAFLLACYNANKQTYETVCNIGTGFSEAILEEFHTKLSENTIERPKPFYSHSAGNKDQPDVWFEPRFVWEVKTADLTLSPRYKAAADQLASGTGKGVSLRFPRFIKERDDKKPEQATSSRQIAEMYQKQESVAKSKGPAVDDDFEY